MYESFSLQARTILAEGASAVAQKRGRGFVGTEDILIALLEDGKNLATRVLALCKVTAESCRDVVDRHAATWTDEPSKGGVGRARAAAESAKILGYLLGSPATEAEHLLLVVLSMADCVAVKVLGALGVTPDKIRRRIFALMSVPPMQS